MRKLLSIDDKEVGFGCSALTPRLYRFKFGRDVIQDLVKLNDSFKKVSGEDTVSVLSTVDLTIFEDLAYIMAKEYDRSIPDDPDEWLEGFSTFSIYEILPFILEMWEQNQKTTSTPVKK